MSTGRAALEAIVTPRGQQGTSDREDKEAGGLLVGSGGWEVGVVQIWPSASTMPHTRRPPNGTETVSRNPHHKDTDLLRG